MVFIDEFAESLLLPPGDRDRLLDLVQVLGYGGRKYGVCCVLLAQSWLTGSIGSSGVRNPLRAAIVHAMRADEGRALTGLRAEAWPSDPQELQPILPPKGNICTMASAGARPPSPQAEHSQEAPPGSGTSKPSHTGSRSPVRWS